MMERYLFLIFILILVFLLVSPNSKAGPILAQLGNLGTNQIQALQGRAGSGSVLGSVS
jgi:hypothetical protein